MKFLKLIKLQIYFLSLISIFTWANKINVFGLPASAACSIMCTQVEVQETSPCKAERWAYTTADGKCQMSWAPLDPFIESMPFQTNARTCTNETLGLACNPLDQAKTCQITKAKLPCWFIKEAPEITNAPFGFINGWACFAGKTKDDISTGCMCL